jgi:two-component SAPR family response regulator
MQKIKSSYSSVMVIDDSQKNCNLLKYILLSLNYAEEVVSFDCPTAGLDYMAKNSNEKFPEIIFLDLSGNLMSNFQFLELFNAFPKEITSEVKIIMMKEPDYDIQVINYPHLQNSIQFIAKPLKGVELAQALSNVFYTHNVSELSA